MDLLPAEIVADPIAGDVQRFAGWHRQDDGVPVHARAVRTSGLIEISTGLALGFPGLDAAFGPSTA